MALQCTDHEEMSAKALEEDRPTLTWQHTTTWAAYWTLAHATQVLAELLTWTYQTATSSISNPITGQCQLQRFNNNSEKIWASSSLVGVNSQGTVIPRSWRADAGSWPIPDVGRVLGVRCVHTAKQLRCLPCQLVWPQQPHPYDHTPHTHTHLKALCPGLPGWAGTRKVKPMVFTGARDS